ncbi:ATPase-like protein [uncultured Caudovirales phage]|uniref:ATPase-like protein n=1 Tax=uncultured Caudovirales phage TaxID=2100421 RepID=A0A6J5PJ09_9CAUD|nr:ATPase-like protein [uncultured Caudovirales phage]
MANKMPIVLSIDYAEQRVTYHEFGSSVQRQDRFQFLSKNGQIAALKFAGFKFTGKTPIGWSVDELRVAWNQQCVWNLNHLPTPTPKEVPIVATTPTPTTPKAPKAPATGIDAVLRDIVTEVLDGYNPEPDTEAIGAIVNDAMAPALASFADVTESLGVLTDTVARLQPKITHIHIPNHDIKIMDGVQHHMFPKVLANISDGTPTYLVGEAGTGKSHIAEQVSKALGVAFSSKSCSSQSTESSLLGYMSATGDYVTTEFRKRFELGGVFLLDEVDNGNPNVLTVLNSALSNSFMAFPDGMVKRHDAFVLIATANTFGHGANAKYVGRNPLDEAFLNRFANLTITYDENIEQAMLDAVGLDASMSAKWLNIVRVARKNVSTYGLHVVVSPRATVYGAKMLRHEGVYNLGEVVEATITKGATPEACEKILMGLSL